jgi:peptidyl-prolyl cis-trans isomerase A (cyclophilin A)
MGIKELIDMKHIARTIFKALFYCAVLFSAATNAQNKPIVTLHTTMGDIVLELDAERAPITVANFLQYAKSGFYENTVFHRVIPRFMIQAGGFTADLEQKETLEPIANESKNRWHNERGTIAMARTNDPDSATAQFFINVRMNARLDYRYRQPGYAVFGKVVEGMDVVDSISFEKTQPKGRHQNVPIRPIVIEKVTLAEQQVSQ